MDTTSKQSWPRPTDAWILAQRPPKPVNDPWRLGGWLVEKEPTPRGSLVDIGTLFLTNRECPFRCLMCDLWKYTVNARVPDRAIPHQIAEGLRLLRPLRHLKLYNAGSFFDAQAIPTRDLPAIADLIAHHERVIVECHPRLVDRRCLEFSRRLEGRLEIALGLETCHPEALARLNKRMTLDDFRRAADFIRTHGLGLRVFVLSTLPFLSRQENLDWACASVEFAFKCGAEIVVVIPTRAGNGAMDRLESEGHFELPKLTDLEWIAAETLERERGIVLIDLWDASKLAACPTCGPARLERLKQMNLNQRLEPPIVCEGCCDAGNLPG
jgi:radical SAM enzyme (TIGR01210 family)